MKLRKNIADWFLFTMVFSELRFSLMSWDTTMLLLSGDSMPTRDIMPYIIASIIPQYILFPTVIFLIYLGIKEFKITSALYHLKLWI